MSSENKVALVLSYLYPGKYALTVLAGAVEPDPLTRQVALRFPRDRESLLASVRECLDEGDQVAVAWSFYSASFPAVAKELAWLRERLEGREVLCLAGGVHAGSQAGPGPGGTTPAGVVLNLAQPLSTRPTSLPLSSSEGGQGWGVPQAVAPSRVPARRAALLAPAAALLGPSAPSLTLHLASLPPIRTLLPQLPLDAL
jgi:hypothetical protein